MVYEKRGQRVPFAWAKLLRGLSDRYGWTWETIARMTFYQALVAFGYESPEDGPTTKGGTGGVGRSIRRLGR